MENEDFAFKPEARHKVITMLDRSELEFLDKLGKDALFSCGHKLSYNEILRALVDFAKEMGISAVNVSSDSDLKERLKEKTISKE